MVRIRWRYAFNVISITLVACAATGFATERVVRLRHSQTQTTDEITNTATRRISDPRNPPQPYNEFLEGNTSEVYTVEEITGLLKQRDDEIATLKANVKKLSENNDALGRRLDKLEAEANQAPTDK